MFKYLDPDNDPREDDQDTKPSHPVIRAIKIGIGSALLAVGIVMFVTPGPALVVIPISLGILASEIPWLKRHLHELRVRIHDYRMRRKAEKKARD